MKKLLCLALSIVMVFSLACLVGCSDKENNTTENAETLKFGLGISAKLENISSADADTNGNAKASVTAAAVLLDKDGKIVKCTIDSMENNMGFTSEGRFIEAGEYRTKYEQGNDYGMVAYANSAKEWFEQIDALCALVQGKNIDEVKALVAADYKGNQEVINAGCTIYISDFVYAIENAVKNAVDSKATNDCTIKLGIVSTQTGSKDATDEAEGANEVDTTVVAASVDKEGKIVAVSTDALAAKVTFDTKGVTATEAAIITTKKDAGANYGMAAYGNDLNGDGKVLEWFEQADAFNAACIGKTASDLSSLTNESGYGSDEIQKSGCTINISDMVKALSKAV